MLESSHPAKALQRPLDLPRYRGQPAGTLLLGWAQFWERFGFYGTMGVLVLYLLAEPGGGGFGWQQAQAFKLVGWYGALTFCAPVVGGLIASNWLGERGAIAAGSIIIICGQLLLLLQALPLMSVEQRSLVLYAALLLVASGTGLLKPSISSLVGRLYPKPGPVKDSGISVFMMCIFFGQFLSYFVIGTLGERLGWPYAFGSAALGMILGSLVYAFLATPFLGTIGVGPSAPAKGASGAPLSALERRRLGVIATFCLFAVAYTAFLFQNKGLLNVIAQQHTDRVVAGFEIPATWFLSVGTGTFIVLAPVASWLWTRLARENRNPNVLFKQGAAFLLLACAYILLYVAADLRTESPAQKTSFLWIVATYFLFGTADLLIWPVQLSAVTSLAPARYSAFLVGLWWFAAGAGIFLTGYVAALTTALGTSGLFAVIVLCCLACAVTLIVLSRRIVPSESI